MFETLQDFVSSFGTGNILLTANAVALTVLGFVSYRSAGRGTVKSEKKVVNPFISYENLSTSFVERSESDNKWAEKLIKKSVAPAFNKAVSALPNTSSLTSGVTVCVPLNKSNAERLSNSDWVTFLGKKIGKNFNDNGWTLTNVSFRGSTYGETTPELRLKVSPKISLSGRSDRKERYSL